MASSRPPNISKKYGESPIFRRSPAPKSSPDLSPPSSSTSARVAPIIAIPRPPKMALDRGFELFLAGVKRHVVLLGLTAHGERDGLADFLNLDDRREQKLFAVAYDRGVFG